MWPRRNAWVCVLRVCLLILLLLIQGDLPQAGGLETRPSLGSLPQSPPCPIPAHQLELTTVRTALMCVPWTPLRRAPHADSDVNGTPERLGRSCITEYSRCGQIPQRRGKPTCAWWGSFTSLGRSWTEVGVTGPQHRRLLPQQTTRGRPALLDTVDRARLHPSATGHGALQRGTGSSQDRPFLMPPIAGRETSVPRGISKVPVDETGPVQSWAHESTEPLL